MPFGIAAAAIPAAVSVGSALFGGGNSNPSVTQEPAPSPQSTVSNDQMSVQNTLASVLNAILGGQGGLNNPGQYTGQNANVPFAAGLTPQQQAIINSIVGNVSPGSGVQNADQTALGALNNVLTSKPLDYSQAFQAVAQPLQQTFSQQTLPSIKAALATSAGGVNSGGNVGLPAAINSATQNLTNAEGNAASTLAYQSGQANVQNILSALGLAPSVTGAPGAQANQALAGASLPQITAQQQLSGQYQDYQTQLQAYLQSLGLAGGFSTSGTVAFPQGNTVVNPGTPNPLSGFLTGLAGNSGLGTALGGFLGSSGGGGFSAADPFGNSDKRLKENIEEVGSLNDGTKLYAYNYKGTSPMARTIGVMAQEVEKKYPSAVVKDDDGMRKVNYVKVIKKAAEAGRRRA